MRLVTKYIYVYSTAWEHDGRLLRRREWHFNYYQDDKLDWKKTPLTLSLDITFGLSRLSSGLKKLIYLQMQ